MLEVSNVPEEISESLHDFMLPVNGVFIEVMHVEGRHPIDLDEGFEVVSYRDGVVGNRLPDLVSGEGVVWVLQ